MNEWEYTEKCCECGNPVDDRKETVWSKVEGWEKKRDQGGTNHVALRNPLGVSMCNACMMLKLSGLSAAQLRIA